ncbi:MAG: DNA polymerase III subunit delta, partial [Candidatus Electrothrix sp. AS4_5]|nr:DNA polymerase III subunit delta [Candidatus Electrothrix gigas]
MKAISTEQLNRHLASGLHPMYIIQGDALLLSIEAADSIRIAAKQAGFEERDTLIAEANFKWTLLQQATQNISLFSSKKVIDLRIPSGKPGTEGAKALLEYVNHLNPDNLTLITLPKLDKSTQKSKWYTTLEKHAVVINANDIDRHALPAWIAGR